MLPLRLVLDTNIILSAALEPDGLQRTVFLLAITKPARPYVSAPVFSKYQDVLSRPELKIRKGQRCANRKLALAGVDLRHHQAADIRCEIAS